MRRRPSREAASGGPGVHSERSRSRAMRAGPSETGSKTPAGPPCQGRPGAAQGNRLKASALP